MIQNPSLEWFLPSLVKIKKLKQMLAKNHWKTNCKEIVFQWFVTVCWWHSCFCVFCLRQISLSGFANKIPTGLEKVGLYMSFFKAFPWILWRNKTNFTQMMRENIPVLSRTPLFPGTWLLYGFLRCLFTKTLTTSPRRDIEGSKRLLNDIPTNIRIEWINCQVLNWCNWWMNLNHQQYGLGKMYPGLHAAYRSMDSLGFYLAEEFGKVPKWNSSWIGFQEILIFRGNQCYISRIWSIEFNMSHERMWTVVCSGKQKSHYQLIPLVARHLVSGMTIQELRILVSECSFWVYWLHSK